MILIQISQTVFVNPEHIRMVEVVMTEEGRRLMAHLEEGAYPITISEADFFNAINSSETTKSINRFEQFKVM